MDEETFRIFFVIPKSNVLIHKTIANRRFSVNCGVLGKFCGNRARTFIVKIKVNNVMVTATLPFFLGRMNFISCFIFSIKVIGICFTILVIFLIGINKNSKKKILYKRFNLKMAEEGSNMENKLFIIFRIFFLLFLLKNE